MWKTMEIVLIALGLLLAFLGNQFSIPILFYASVSCFGLAMMAVGWQAILTQHMVLGRRRGYRETYTGIPAIYQGVQFNFIGLFLIGVAFMAYFNYGQEIFLQMVRRPGLPLVLLGGLSIMQSLIAFSGPQEARQGAQWVVIANLLFSRLLPGFILMVIGVGLSFLGLFEAAAPEKFDELGGGFLEELYGLR